MSELIKGETVRLKSGGPLMTIKEICDNKIPNNPILIDCVWFVESELYHETFEKELLVKDNGESSGFAVY